VAQQSNPLLKRCPPMAEIRSGVFLYRKALLEWALPVRPHGHGNRKTRRLAQLVIPSARGGGTEVHSREPEDPSRWSCRPAGMGESEGRGRRLHGGGLAGSRTSGSDLRDPFLSIVTSSSGRSGCKCAGPVTSAWCNLDLRCDGLDHSAASSRRCERQTRSVSLNNSFIEPRGSRTVEHVLPLGESGSCNG